LRSGLSLGATEGGTNRGIELGAAPTRVATRTGLSLDSGFGDFLGDFLGDGLGVTISSTTHCGLLGAWRKRWIRTAISRSGSIVPRCEEPKSFMSVTDVASLIFGGFLKLEKKSPLTLVGNFGLYNCLGEIFFQARRRSVEMGGADDPKNFHFQAETRVFFGPQKKLVLFRSRKKPPFHKSGLFRIF
jgi:hypothetical protein